MRLIIQSKAGVPSEMCSEDTVLRESRTDAALELRGGFQRSKEKSMVKVVTNKPPLRGLIQGWL